MRIARIKVDQVDTWYHCFNQTVGTSEARPFGDVEKAQFVRFLRRVSLLYGVRVVAYQVMSNHFHLLVHAPAALPSEEEICRRYRIFHRGKKTLKPGTPDCANWQKRSRDISWFMRHLQQLFTMWFNPTRDISRRGSLWASRFKHTILEHTAVWRLLKYIENNPVRAGMVKHAGDYRFCSYGAWCQSGRHPFEQNVNGLMLPLMGVTCLDVLMKMLGTELYSKIPQSEDIGFSLTVRRRVRYWKDGLVIGSALFVRSIMAQYHPAPERHRLAPPTSDRIPITAWRRLRNA